MISIILWHIYVCFTLLKLAYISIVTINRKTLVHIRLIVSAGRIIINTTPIPLVLMQCWLQLLLYYRCPGQTCLLQPITLWYRIETLNLLASTTKFHLPPSNTSSTLLPSLDLRPFSLPPSIYLRPLLLPVFISLRSFNPQPTFSFYLPPSNFIELAAFIELTAAYGLNLNSKKVYRA